MTPRQPHRAGNGIAHTLKRRDCAFRFGEFPQRASGRITRAGYTSIVESVSRGQLEESAALQWRRTCILISAGILVLGIVLLNAGPRSKTRIVETLNHPVRLLGWDPEGVTLEGGRKVPLPELSKLPPSDSPVLQSVLAGGVEVSPEGRLFVLVKIWHWCGNDPLREHVARVDLSRFLLFTGEGEPARPLSRFAKEGVRPDRERILSDFQRCGWSVGDFQRYRYWNTAIEKGEFPLFE